MNSINFIDKLFLNVICFSLAKFLFYGAPNKFVNKKS